MRDCLCLCLYVCVCFRGFTGETVRLRREERDICLFTNSQHSAHVLSKHIPHTTHTHTHTHAHMHMHIHKHTHTHTHTDTKRERIITVHWTITIYIQSSPPPSHTNKKD